MNREIRTYFELEARELVDRLTAGVAQLDGSPHQPEALAALARAAHTLKGAAHVVGEKGIAALAHQFEDALEEYRRGSDAAGTARLLHLTDALAAALTDAQTASSGAGPGSDAAEAALLSAVSAATAQTSHSNAEEGLNLRTSDLPSQPLEPETLNATIRVDREETGELLTQIHNSGALVAALRASVGQLAQLEAEAALEFESAGPAAAKDKSGSLDSAWRRSFSGLREQLQHDAERLDRQIAELQQVATRLNLVSTASLLIEAGRIVRSTAAATHRDVVCVTEGGKDRVDSQIVEAFHDALLHLVRNAVAHGIESAAERKRAGKPKTATITVAVRRRGSDLVLTCADDGGGIALEPIRKAAAERGLMSAERAAAASPEALLALLLRRGFSTRLKSDELAGRGVGLDAVHAVAERLHGQVRISSEPGRGTTVSLTAPRTLFSLRVLVVTVAGARYAVPVELVEQTFRLEPHHKVTGQGSRTVLLDREAMPYLALEDVMPTPAGHHAGADRGAGRKESRTCVVLRTGTGPLALAVDRVETMAEVLVQPLPAASRAAATIAGAALSSDGQPLLVLAPEALLGSVGATQAAHSQPGGDVEAAAPTRPILVIDDSLTTRMLEQSILEGEGYTVDLAVSAEQGLAMARQKRYSLFLVDVEMPGMNGFEFVRLAKADPALQSVPSILVTSLDSAEARASGRAAGAVSYVVKGEFNQKIYLNRIRSVIRGAS